MPRAVEGRQRQGRRAHPEEPAVGDDIHGGIRVPRVAHAQHVIQHAHDENSGQTPRVRVGEIIDRNQQS